jgi:hypothetical protein
MEDDVCSSEGVGDCSTIVEVTFPEFYRGDCLAEETAMTECEDAVPGGGKAPAEVYAEEPSAAKHDAETPSRLYTFLGPGFNGTPSDIQRPHIA